MGPLFSITFLGLANTLRASALLSAVTVIKLYFKARETGVERIYRLLLTTTLLMLLFCALL